MSWLPLSFGVPAVLWGLLALPVIWWLLRLTPPRPQMELFPPLRILQRVLKKEETPYQSPWWLTLLRLLMAALIVLALAEPIFNPRDRVASGDGAMAIVIDNGWASAPDWELRVATAERLIEDAAATGSPVVLAMTADLPNADIGPFDADTAHDRLAAAEPHPVSVDRPAIFARVAAAIEPLPNPAVAVLSDGLEAEGDAAAFQRLLAPASSLVWIAPDDLPILGTVSVENRPDEFAVTAVRAADPMPRQANIVALDEQGRGIAETVLSFGPGETRASAAMAVPFELRNDFSAIIIDGEEQAAAVRVLDENSRRRRIGLISQAEADQAQPLLSPLYYIRNALSPFADLVETQSADLARAVPQILQQKPAMIVMADVGTLPDEAHQALVDWVEGGGTLVRFAGSRLAAAEHDEDLLPVRLRTGERSLGGTLSWTEPQPIVGFPDTGPFSGLPAPSEVTVTRQVLAEPSSDIVERTWASLADGTPLVTGDRRGEGTLALFHVTPEATWSNLPISGTFVEMLRRIVQLSRNQGAIAASGGENGQPLPPYRMISADGGLVPPTPEARPLDFSAGEPSVTIENPPGLYGGEEGVVAHNLLPRDATFNPIARPQTPLPITEASYAADEQVDLKGPLVTAALILLALDTLAVFWMGGLFSRRAAMRPRAASTAAAGAIAAMALSILMLSPGPALAQDQDAPPPATQQQEVSDAEAIDAISRTRLAYVVTGNSSVDSVSRSGLAGLTRFLTSKTALEPAEPAGVDIETDELSFYPLIYWPVDAGAPMPSDAAIARVDAYMQAGGTVLFDTRDQYSTSLDAGSSPANRRLRDILDDLNVPPLEPVPEDHVLTKAFFILNEFPGRYAGSPLWVEASLNAESRQDRPVRVGDGVTPIMITGNDFAGAWATDSDGAPLFPTVPSDPLQRTYAFRAGVNIMMYMLTGNYKSDQVHVPVLLERLGQ
ncbi:MAG: DUF4159 domain-containing protein [Rhizobiaceae bacterium]|nr:DUF4159 domain-containing protein [Rhizobiaceae bacterium]MCV0407794.1 DUF4159 domain-containing protein [Rhizobiaceae bacterium]